MELHNICVCVHLVTQLCLTLQPHGLWPTRLLCPWNFPGINTGAGYRFPLQGIFLTQGLNPSLRGLLHWQADSLLLHHLGSPIIFIDQLINNWHYFSSMNIAYLCMYSRLFSFPLGIYSFFF